MKNQQIVAIVLMAIVVLWMVVPRSEDSANNSNAEAQRVVEVVPEDARPSESPEVLTVRAARISPQAYTERVRVRGRTQAYRHVMVRAEQAGRIINNPVPRGARVTEGDLLCELAEDTRGAALAEAISRRKQAQFEYDAAVELQKDGLQSDVAVAQLAAALEAAEAAVTRAEWALERIHIKAPFDGVVEIRTVEKGDLLNVGDVCASVLDDSPMLLVGLVPEQQVAKVNVGARVDAELLGGQRVSGTVTYLSRAADEVSRSYRIEVQVDPNGVDIREGITAELLVDSETVLAHRIPSSALTLDDNGSMGVKLIDDSNTVHFSNVTIVGDDTGQMDPRIWVTGLQGDVNLVTLGQEIVFPGQTVQSNFDWSN